MPADRDRECLKTRMTTGACAGARPALPFTTAADASRPRDRRRAASPRTDAIREPGRTRTRADARDAEMRWLSLVGTICKTLICLWSVWLMLLAYRVAGKNAGQDPT